MQDSQTTGAAGLGVTSWTLPVRGEQAICWAAARGLTTMHVDVDDLSGGADALVEVGRSYGIRLGGFAVSQLERVGLLDPAAARRVLDDALGHAVELEAKLMYLPAFGAARIRTPADLRVTAELLRHALAESPTQLSVASESTLDRDASMRLLDMVEDDRLQLLLDTQNPAVAGHSAVALVRSFAHCLAPFVHVKDGVASLGDAVPGTGRAGVADTLAALAQVRYRGTHVLEGDYRSAGADRVDADVRALRALLAQPPIASAA